MANDAQGEASVSPLPEPILSPAAIVRLEARLAGIAADFVVRQVEQQEASETHAATRANLRAALVHAQAVGLTVPGGVMEVVS